MRPNSWVDRAMVTLAVAGQSVPVFWLAIMLVMVFTVRLDWLPATGRGGLDHLILPAACLSTFSIASIARLLRSTMMDVMSQDYIRTAYAKGLTTRTTVIRHALRNAGLPVITVMGLQVVGLLSGVIIVEVVFVWRGMGDLMVNAILFRDFPIVQGAVLIFAVTAVLANFLVDLIYAYIDPRVRYA
jgi:ABC-type dipeptide/oligopeptide/nickel transport system permease component